ncbi:hypothetical protein MFFC18_26390 [Mariniblastus fucicola]|uniref:Uncharacterized protein n=1 Tax=Mariniblastus fucicola TaxID=980251 RepID=A0A5B9PDV9_9BACT|nr:hypothetical protein MFFC18_26390 [Mariniblastus fucicola]
MPGLSFERSNSVEPRAKKKSRRTAAGPIWIHVGESASSLARSVVRLALVAIQSHRELFVYSATGQNDESDSVELSSSRRAIVDLIDARLKSQLSLDNVALGRRSKHSGKNRGAIGYGYRDALPELMHNGLPSHS